MRRGVQAVSESGAHGVEAKVPGPQLVQGRHTVLAELEHADTWVVWPATHEVQASHTVLLVSLQGTRA